jgi:hypothetical protein
MIELFETCGYSVRRYEPGTSTKAKRARMMSLVLRCDVLVKQYMTVAVSR